MRYVKTRKEHICPVCKETIEVNEIAIQSQGYYNLVYHEDCHNEKFGNSSLHKPKNQKPKEADLVGSPIHN